MESEDVIHGRCLGLGGVRLESRIVAPIYLPLTEHRRV